MDTSEPWSSTMGTSVVRFRTGNLKERMSFFFFFGGTTVTHAKLHRYCSLPNCPNRFCFAFRREYVLTDLGTMTLSAHRSFVERPQQCAGPADSASSHHLWARHGGDKINSPDILPENLPCFHCIAIGFRSVSAFFMLRVTPCALQRITLRLAKVEQASTHRFTHGWMVHRPKHNSRRDQKRFVQKCGRLCPNVLKRKQSSNGTLQNPKCKLHAR